MCAFSGSSDGKEPSLDLQITKRAALDRTAAWFLRTIIIRELASPDKLLGRRHIGHMLSWKVTFLVRVKKVIGVL